MTEDARARALAYVAGHHVMTLATHGPQGVWAAAVFYAHDGFRFVFLSASHTRHAQNMAAAPEVAATIQSDYDDWTAIKGIQLEGTVEQLDGARRAAALALARAGAAVCANSINPDRAASVVAEIEAGGGRAMAWTADVSDRFQVAAMIEQVSAELVEPIRAVGVGVPGRTRERRMETRFIVPGSMVANLDFVEGIFGNAGDPYLPENDAALDPLGWTGHTGCGQERVQIGDHGLGGSGLGNGVAAALVVRGIGVKQGPWPVVGAHAREPGHAGQDCRRGNPIWQNGPGAARVAEARNEHDGGATLRTALEKHPPPAADSHQPREVAVASDGAGLYRRKRHDIAA